MEKRKGLPMELVMEILLKMPTRAVLRFSCVSKTWHNLIMQDEYFGDLHLQRSPHEFNPTYLFFYCQYLDIGKQLNIGMSISNSLTHNIIKLHCNPLVVKPGFRYSKECDDSLLPYDFSATCNGLLCLVPSLDERNDPILLCNPITAEYLKLPPLNIKKIFEYDVGLGFAPFSKQYKVVCLLSYGGRKSYMWVHTVGADRSWRKIKMNEQDFVTNSSSILYLDGKIYYLVERTGPGLKFKKSTMLEFDVESEKAIMLDHAAFPNHCRFSEDDQLVNLPSCGGKGLSLFTIKQEKSSSVLDVWVLKEDYKWDLRHQIDFPQSDKPRTMLSVWELVDGDILIFLADNLMVRYNKNTGITITEQLPELRFYTLVKRTCCVCHGYNPSLVSLKKYGSTQTERLSSADDKSLPPTPRIQLPPTLNN